MKSMKRPLEILMFILLITLLPGKSLPAQAVLKRMESPLFWTQKIKNPDRLLLTSDQIAKMNEENLGRSDLLLCKVKDMKGEWTREEILVFLREDWREFGKSEQVRYGKRGTPLDDAFWSGLRENIHQAGLKEKNKLLFGLTIKRTDIRVFPTEECSMHTPSNVDFDLFQHSAIAPASLVGIYHFSHDNLWAYVQTPFIRGWIQTKDLAIAKDQDDVVSRGGIIEPLVITGNFVTVFADPLFRQPVFSAQMGTTFPILHFPGDLKISNHPIENNPKIPSPLRGCVVIGGTVKNVMPNLFRHLIIPRTYETLKQVQGDKKVITTQSLMGEGQGEGEIDHGHPHLNPPPSNGRIIVGKFPLSKGGHAAIGNYYVVKIPSREADGRLTFRHGYIPAHADVHHGFLPYTQNHLAQQAFKMLHEPYGWGEMSGGRDCSRFIMDIFNTFGILMPRNSILQAKMGVSLGLLQGKGVKQKKKILEQAVPLATLLRMPGHIMLYLGEHEGKPYAIHSIWGVQKKGRSGIHTQKIGKVAVTDLDLGREGPNGSLLHRLTEIQFVGIDHRVIN